MRLRTDELKELYQLEQHPEGGWFAEVYTAPFDKDGRPLAGSIYFLLDTGELSYTFVSCATTPNFTYDGFRLVGKEEIKDKYPEIAGEIEYLAYEA